MSPHPFWSKAGSWQLPAFKEETMIGFCSFSHSPYHRFPNCYFISCKGWRDRGWSRCKAKGELWFGWVTYALGLASELIPSPGFYRHTHHWGPRTCKSCTAGSAFHSQWPLPLWWSTQCCSGAGLLCFRKADRAHPFSTMFREFRLVAGNWPWWEYLCSGKWKNAKNQNLLVCFQGVGS